MYGLSAERLAALSAVALAGLVAAYGVRAGFFVAGGTDSSGYVSASERWRDGELFGPAPLHFLATWPNAEASASPVAYRPGPIRGTDVPIYPLGLPVFFAAARAIGGPLAPFLVAPLFAALLTWCTFLIGRALAGPLAGLVAAILIATTPVVLLHTVDAMSDVPAAALWMLALVIVLDAPGLSAVAPRRNTGAKADALGAAGSAGLAVAATAMIRPNLVPLAVVPGLVVLLGGGAEWRRPAAWHWRNACVFGALASVGPLLVMWSQSVLYGSPFVPGYVEWESFFRLAHIRLNLTLYPRLLIGLHTPFVLLGLAAPLVIRSRAVWPVTAVLVISLAIYLPYLSLDDWPFLRFLLPGLAALFVLFAAVLARAAEWLWSGRRWLAPAALLPAVLVVWQAAPQRRFALNEWQAQTRVRLMGHYLREVLPSNAAVLSFTHSGAVRYYTGRQIVRLDLIEPAMLDRIVDDLRRKAYRPVLVLDEVIESAFRTRFMASRYGALDWLPRATFTSTTRILYLDLEDRERHARGERWPVDQVK